MAVFVHLVYLVKITEKHQKMKVFVQAVVVIVCYVEVAVVLFIDQLEPFFVKYMDSKKVVDVRMISVQHGVAQFVVFVKKHEKSEVEVKYK